MGNGDVPVIFVRWKESRLEKVVSTNNCMATSQSFTLHPHRESPQCEQCCVDWHILRIHRHQWTTCHSCGISIFCQGNGLSCRCNWGVAREPLVQAAGPYHGHLDCEWEHLISRTAAECRPGDLPAFTWYLRASFFDGRWLVWVFLLQNSLKRTLSVSSPLCPYSEQTNRAHPFVCHHCHQMTYRPSTWLRTCQSQKPPAQIPATFLCLVHTCAIASC